jgi:prepilin-type N-terminal cleavage/methylation domain-containing protein
MKIRTAFTLIELLVVIAIIGILSGLIVVSMSGVTSKANIAKGQVFNNSLRNALMLNLISEWKFDELSTAVQGSTIRDSWSGGNNCTLSTNSDGLDKLRTGAYCVSGKCLSFDGTDDYANCGTGSNLNLTSSGTVSLWAYFTSASFASAREDFFSRDEKEIIVSIGNTPSNRQIFVWYANSSTPTWQACSTSINTLSDNQWVNIVATIDVPNNVFKIYLNGTEKASCATSGNIYSGTGNYTIASQGTSRYFNGLMDDVRIYGAAIPTSQIKEQYYAGLNKLLISGGISQSEYAERMKNETAKI